MIRGLIFLNALLSNIYAFLTSHYLTWNSNVVMETSVVPMPISENCEPKIRPMKNHENLLTILRFEEHHV